MGLSPVPFNSAGTKQNLRQRVERALDRSQDVVPEQPDRSQRRPRPEQGPAPEAGDDDDDSDDDDVENVQPAEAVQVLFNGEHRQSRSGSCRRSNRR